MKGGEEFSGAEIHWMKVGGARFSVEFLNELRTWAGNVAAFCVQLQKNVV